jgi:hypothetical protein
MNLSVGGTAGGIDAWFKICGRVNYSSYAFIRSERQLIEQLHYICSYLWFVGLGVDDPVLDA